MRRRAFIRGTSQLELKLPQRLARQQAEVKMPKFESDVCQEETSALPPLEPKAPRLNECFVDVPTAVRYPSQLLRMEEVMLQHQLSARESIDAYLQAKMMFRTSDRQASSASRLTGDNCVALQLLAERDKLLTGPLVCKPGHSHKDAAVAKLRAQWPDFSEDLIRDYLKVGCRLESLQRRTSSEMPLAHYGRFARW